VDNMDKYAKFLGGVRSGVMDVEKIVILDGG